METIGTFQLPRPPCCRPGFMARICHLKSRRPKKGVGYEPLGRVRWARSQEAKIGGPQVRVQDLGFRV